MPGFIHSRRSFDVLVVCLSLVGSNAGAQDRDRSLTKLAGVVELARLVDLAAQKLGLKIEYDPKTLRGVEVTLRLRGGITDQELWMVTNQLLTSRGFATVQMPGSDLISIAKVASAQGLARLEERDYDQAQAGYLTVLFELEHRDVKEVSDAIRPLLSKPGGSIAALGKTGFVLLSDYKPRIDQALAVIERIDVPLKAAVIETVPVENLGASQLTGLVNAAATASAAVTGAPLKGKLIPVPDGNAVVVVAPESEMDHWRDMLARFDRRQALETRSYAPRYFAVREVTQLIDAVARDESPRGSGHQWEVITDDLTGTLIVTATPAEHEQIEALIQRLDGVSGTARRPVRAFPIRNRSVHEILEVLTRLIEAGMLEAGGLETTRDQRIAPARQRSERQVLPPGAEPILRPQTGRQPDQRNQPGASRRAGGVGQEEPLTLTADEGTNTLIAIGDPRRLTQLEQLIRTLDVRQPQVMIELLVVTLTDAQTLDLGVELETMGVSGSTLFTLSSLFDLGAVGLAPSDPPSGAGGTALVLSPGDFRILIRALETLNEGRALNIPRILVSNNEEATLDSVLQRPFTSINASTTIATTSFGGTQDAGTTITVRPQIAEGDHLRLEYTVSLSTFVGESTDPSLPPARQQNNLTSVVTIPDGFTVVVGGLETITETETVSQVPLLGDIPILGELFKNRSKSQTRARFFVFIRADVLRNAEFEDLKYLSDRDIATLDIDDGWPEVEPRIIR